MSYTKRQIIDALNKEIHRMMSFRCKAEHISDRLDSLHRVGKLLGLKTNADKGSQNSRVVTKKVYIR